MSDLIWKYEYSFQCFVVAMYSCSEIHPSILYTYSFWLKLGVCYLVLDQILSVLQECEELAGHDLPAFITIYAVSSVKVIRITICYICISVFNAETLQCMTF